MVHLIKNLVYRPMLLGQLTKIIASYIVLLIYSCGTDEGSPNESSNDDGAEDILYYKPALIFSPDSFDIEVGDNFNTIVYAMGPENLRGVSVIIEYDSTKLKIDYINDGNLSSGSSSMFFVDTISSGVIEIVSVYISDNAQSVDNDISIAEIVFKSISPGISQIKFNRDSEMVDPDGNQIQIRHRGIGFIDAK